jgi:hypothetical protein
LEESLKNEPDFHENLGGRGAALDGFLNIPAPVELSPLKSCVAIVRAEV